MGFFRYNYRSQALGRYVDVTVVIPTSKLSYYPMSTGFRHNDEYRGAAKGDGMYAPGMKFQTVYLMHGGGDDDSMTYRYINAERYAEDNSVMLVTPNIVNSFGVNTNYGVAYSTFLTEELPLVMQSLFPSSPKREDNFIVGYAMGGNVALGTALMRPDLYSACIDLSGGIGLTLDTEQFEEELRGEHFNKDFPLVVTTFGKAEDLAGSRHDMRLVAQRNIDNGVELPKFYLVAGGNEGNIGKRVARDAEILKEMGYDVTYICEEGHGHDFKLWDLYVKRSLYELLPLKREILFP